MFQLCIMSNTKTIRKGTFVKMKALFIRGLVINQLYAVSYVEAPIIFNFRF